MEPDKKIRDYGAWPSLITAEWMGQRLRFEDVRWTADGRELIWVEGRSGQNVLVCQPDDGERYDLLTEHSARGGVLYGGGEFNLSRESLFFVERSTQLYRRDFANGKLTVLQTPAGSLAAPTPSPDGRWVVYVYTDGREDALVLADATGSKPSEVLARGADFYMQPAWSPDGSSLVWVEWDHPNMPWDATRILLARLAGSPLRVADKIVVAGGELNHTQPRFSPDGRWMSYITARGNWEALALFDLGSKVTRQLLDVENLLLSTPAWVQGLHTYAWSHTGERIYAIKTFAGRASLISIDAASGAVLPIDSGPYTWLKQLSASPVNDQLAMVASSPQIPEQVVRWDGQSWVTIRRSDQQSLPGELFSVPEDVWWLSEAGVKLHALFFPPANPNYRGMGAPPVIVNIHGGPTHQVRCDLPREAPYFTSRGYAWLEVSYRGSIGFGWDYQDALDERWGELDLEDTISGVQEAIRRGLVDGSRVALFGGSAGGLTVLNALVKYPGRFKAGICLYPVTDFLDPGLVADKFESRMLDRLVGLLPRDEEVYRQRSPIYHADQIRDPVAIFHGDLDTAVPAAQSEQIAASLKKRGVPVLLQIYEGEGHGFRQAENVRDCLWQIERFLDEHINRKA